MEAGSARRRRTLGRFRTAGDSRLVLRRLGAFLGGLGHLGVDGLHSLAGFGDALAAVWDGVDELFEAGGELWSKRCPDFAEERLDLGEDADVLAVAVRERLGIEITKIPVARFAHGLFAAQIVKIEDESCFFLF